MKFTLCLLAATMACAAAADERAALDHFESSVRPLLAARCESCHGSEKQKGALRLDTREGWTAGGSRGAVIVPGKPDESLLIQAVRRSDPHLQMPPDDALTETEIAALTQWIANGAPDSRLGTMGKPPHEKADPHTFWSFQPVHAVEPPAVASPDWVRNPVDNFILSKLNEMGLSPAPQADARTLIRRAYVDLLGLPPTPEQVDAFVNDTSPDAWAELIETLLASPHYGERWGRHWLDVARYADSGGFETDMYYRNAWRYRDYVVKSFNDDKPYDVFVQEQIAGDELWPGNIDQAGSYEVPTDNLRRLEARTGTGLYTLEPQVHESNMDGQKIRYETFSDWVDTTGAAFMGLTFGCARCHDHKFDPISQRDYYGMQAIFAGSKEVLEPTVPPMSVADFKQHYPRVVAVDEARRAVRLFDARTKGRDLSEAEKAERQGLMNRIAEAVMAVPQKTAQGEDFDGLFEVPSVSVLGHENPDLVPAIHILNRGELARPEAQVVPALPEAIRDASGWTESVPGPSGSRTTLARWLTSPAHPLTARVMVNRIWYGHFGRGIVASLNDFGQMGERPTHPELLDWLATAFVQHGWRVKDLHRLIMLSATYQMSSTFQNEANAAIDPSNHFLWKMNRRRMEAEALWDAMHAVAGTINLKMGGRPVVPPLMADEGAPAYWTVSADPADHNRRGLYVLQRRNFRFPMFDVFDLPVNAVSAPSRETTSVATQALWLLNNATARQQAEDFAARLTGSTEERIDQAWRIGLGRTPTTEEKTEALALLERLSPGKPLDAMAQLCLAVFNLQEFAYVD